MPTIKYRVRGKKKNASIYLKFSNSRDEQFEVNSGYFIPDTEWFNNSTGKPRRIAKFIEHDALKKSLDQLKLDIEKTFNSTSEFTKEWLKNQIDKHHGKTTKDTNLFIDIIKQFIDYKTYSSEDELTASTLKSYEITKYRVKLFEEYKKKQYRIDQVGSDFKDEFVKWAKSIQNYQPSTYKKTLKQIRTICRYAKTKKQIEIDETIFVAETSKSKAKRNNEKQDRKFPTITIEELNKIKQLNGAEYLENARDWLIISCWTACRVSDLMQLTKNNLGLTIEGIKTIEYTQEKTAFDVEVPLHPDVEEIIQRRNGFPKPISHQKYNDYIKVVCKNAGLDQLIEGSKMQYNPETEQKRKIKGKFPKYELISSHIGRRSFSTNHYGKFSNYQIMAITGHKTERQFLDYIGKKSSEHLTDFMKYWRQQQEARKNKKIG